MTSRRPIFDQELEMLRDQHCFRSPAPVLSVQGSRITVLGRDLLLLCSNDYLGLASHPALGQAAAEAMTRYGFGSGAARLVSGTNPLYEELEQRLADFKGTERAVLFNTGYMANTGIIPAVAAEGDAVFSDALNHASIIDGCRLSRAAVHIYRHRDLNDLERLLKGARRSRRRLIVTDGVFSMDGDIAPLPGIVSLASRYDALVMVDDAHATGVLGDRGKGTAEHFGLQGQIHIQMGTLGKALGAFGAYAAGDHGLVEYLMNKARSFIFSTSLPPAVCAASIAALKVLDSEGWRRERLWRNCTAFSDGLRKLGFDIGPTETPIIPVLCGGSEKALSMSRDLLELGVFAAGIRPPAVPEGSARIRTTVTASHSDKDIADALELFRRVQQRGHA